MADTNRRPRATPATNRLPAAGVRRRPRATPATDRLPAAGVRRRPAAGVRRRPRAILAAALAAAVLAGTLGACSETQEQPTTGELDPVRILRPDPGASGATEPRRSDGLQVVEKTDRLEGLIVNQYDLEVGQCFNSYLTALGDNRFRELTTLVDCAGPHDGEVYFQVLHPGEAGEPYPGPGKMPAWAQDRCYERFGEFVGQEYELSELEIGVLHPTEETWTGVGRHREVTCYVEAWGGGRLLGSMRLSGF